MTRTMIEIQDGRVTVSVDGEKSSLTGPLYKAAVDAERELVAAQGRVTELEAELERYRRAHVCSVRCAPNAHVAMEGRKLVADLETALAESREIVAQRNEALDQAADDLARSREATALALNGRDELARQLRKITAERDRLEKDAAERDIKMDMTAGDLERSQAVVTELRRALEARDNRLAELERRMYEYDRDRVSERDRADTAEKTLAERSRLLAEATGDRDRLAAQIGRVNGAVHSPAILGALRSPWQGWTESEAVALTRAVQDTRRAIGSPNLSIVPPA